jgi:hypothetical protein
MVSCIYWCITWCANRISMGSTPQPVMKTRSWNKMRDACVWYASDMVTHNTCPCKVLVGSICGASPPWGETYAKGEGDARHGRGGVPLP